MTTSPIRKALQSRSKQQLDDISLLRILVSHGVWRVPAIAEDGKHRLLVQDRAGERWLQIFTDGEALDQHLQAIGHAGGLASVETTGEWLFSNLDDKLNGLTINPSLPDEIQFSRENFPSLRSWGRAVAVETALAEQRDGDDAFKLLCESDFLIAFIPTDSGVPQIALAPDPQGRQLAAVFTAPDTARDFMDAASRALGRKLTVQSVPGRDLFANLGQMPLDGLVFNCLGPINPIAVTQAFIQAFTQTSD